MLIKDTLRKYKGQVRLVTEYYGASKLSERYGLRRYPAVFVDDILLAGPADFGWYSITEGKGKYSPWIETASHEKFQRDLSKMIDLVLSGNRDEALKNQGSASGEEIKSLPRFSLKDSTGRVVDSAALANKAVVVEFWATWCPPCRETLAWLADLERNRKQDITVIAISVESTLDDVKKFAATMPASFHFVVGSGDEANTFGDLTNIPTMYVFDRQGNRAAVFYGAAPDLHEKAGKLLSTLSNK